MSRWQWQFNCSLSSAVRNITGPGFAVLFCTFALSISGSGEDSSGQRLSIRLAKTVQRQEEVVDQVQSWRRYMLHSSRWKTDGTMDVLVRVDGAGVEQAPEVIGINAEGLQKEILRHIVEGEVEASNRKHFVPITLQDYTMVPEGIKLLRGRPCRDFVITPKRPSRYTIEGRACVDLADAAVAHFEGQTSRSVSFWVGKPRIEQDFRKVGDYWLCSRNRSAAMVKILGETTLTIEYRDYVVRPKSGSILTACASRPCGANLS